MIVFAEFFNTGLFRVDAAGGEPSPLTTLNPAEDEDGHLWPKFLPDGNHFLFLIPSRRRERSTIALGSLDAKTIRQIAAADALVDFVPPDALLFVRDGALYRQAFNLKTLAVDGTAARLVEQVRCFPVDSRAFVSASQNGVLAYGSEVGVPGQLTWLDRTGLKVGTVGTAGVRGEFNLAPNDSLSRRRGRTRARAGTNFGRSMPRQASKTF